MYRPNDPTQDLAAFLRRELAEIAREMVAPVEAARFVELHAEPKRVADGMVVLADGTDWDPGSGAGFYGYYGAAWHKLG